MSKISYDQFGLTIAAIAGRAHEAGQIGKKRTPTFLRIALGREPSTDEFAAMRTEVSRQNNVRLARQTARGEYLGSWPDRLAMRATLQVGHFAREAAFRHRNCDRLAALARVRDGVRDKSTMCAAGLGHLLGRRQKSKRGTWGIVTGGKVFSLNGIECELLGLDSGPGNFYF